MRYLLDKNVVRYAIQGLVQGFDRQLSALEFGSLSFWQIAESRDARLLISHASFNVLKSFPRYSEISIFLAATDVLYPARYHNRWTRRVRETSRLSREDSAMLALATFGTNDSGSIIGTHGFVTYDQPLINGFKNHHQVLQKRLSAMTCQLKPPYDQATLPILIRPDEVKL